MKHSVIVVTHMGHNFLSIQFWLQPEVGSFAVFNHLPLGNFAKYFHKDVNSKYVSCQLEEFCLL